MISQMKTPKTRAEFERAFYIAIEQLREGKMRFAMGLEDYIFSLRSVRKLPNGRLDCLSVNESARLHANQMVSMLDFPPFKSDENVEHESPAPRAPTTKKKTASRRSGAKKVSSTKKTGNQSKPIPQKKTQKKSNSPKKRGRKPKGR